MAERWTLGLEKRDMTYMAITVIVVLSCWSLDGFLKYQRSQWEGGPHSSSPISNIPHNYCKMADVHFHHLWKISPYRAEDLPLKLKVKYCKLMESIELIDQHIEEGDFPALDKLYSGGWVSWDQRSAVIARWGARSGVVKEHKRQILLQLQHLASIPRKRPGKSRQSKQARARRKAKLEASQHRKADQQTRQDRRNVEKSWNGRPSLNNPQQQKKNKNKKRADCYQMISLTLLRIGLRTM